MPAGVQASHEVVEFGGGSFVLRGHRVTLSEFKHELERRPHDDPP